MHLIERLGKLRFQELMRHISAGFGGSPAIGFLRAAIPEQNGAVHIADDDGVVSELQQFGMKPAAGGARSASFSGPFLCAELIGHSSGYLVPAMNPDGNPIIQVSDISSHRRAGVCRWLKPAAIERKNVHSAKPIRAAADSSPQKTACAAPSPPPPSPASGPAISASSRWHPPSALAAPFASNRAA